MARAHRVDDRVTVIHCPGCKEAHPFDQRWTFNGNYDLPTFTPSLRVMGAREGETKCHSFVTNGRIEFCGDSPHALAGQTVDLPEWDDETSW